MSDTQTSTAWTWLEPVVQDIEQMWDALRDVVPDRWVEETDPHVSVLPSFEVPEEEMGDVVAACVEASEDLVGTTVDVTGFHCFKTLDSDGETFVIGLDVDAAFESTRRRQERHVNAAGGELLYEPVPPHITLLKEGDGGDDTDGLTDEQEADVEQRLAQLCEEAQFEATVGAAPADTFLPGVRVAVSTQPETVLFRLSLGVCSVPPMSQKSIQS